ncbi:MAG: hypothetical protein KAX49_14360 [Halanaerobiales bacterium]|nr:hypothetical protein [Halanaerobiales bacterium]
MSNWKNVGDVAERSVYNPIIKPNPENGWETELVYNAAAMKLGNWVFVIYRAMGDDHVARFGLAYSENGIDFDRFDFPIMQPKEYYELPHETTLSRERERGGIEDPRAIVIDDTIYLYYTSFHKKCHISMASMKVENFLKLFHLGNEKKYAVSWNDAWERHGLAFPDQFNDADVFSRNAVLHKLKDDLFMLLYRVDKGNINYSFATTPTGPWKHEDNSFISKDYPWESERIGISTPAVEITYDDKTYDLFLYHGVESGEEGVERIYKVGAFLLDTNLENNELVVSKLQNPIMRPAESYELDSKWLSPCGVKAVFPCGTVKMGNEIYIYYGAGDQVIGLAKINSDDLLTQKVKTSLIKI